LILAVDVQYDKTGGIVAGVAFKDWGDSNESDSYLSDVENVGDYIPGQFYKRELPCILRLLSEYHLKPDCIVIDGYVYLDGHAKPGLGKHLYDALHGNIKVIGVAKKPFTGIDEECKLFRGSSNKALFITCIGMELSAAKAYIKAMHGAHRIPTILKKVDQLCRQRTPRQF
jgi:deoxyribonuclease V